MNRKLKIWKDYGKIYAKSFIFTVAAVFIWYLFFWRNFTLFPESEEIMSAVVGGFLVFSALLPTFTISRLSQQYDELKSAILRKNKEEFKRIYKKNLHPLTYQAIIVVSSLAIISLMIEPYQRAIVGIFSVGGLSFVHSFFFLIARELDNPNCWHLDIPEEWLNEIKKGK